jgi:large subunit ribosomal protein L3
MVGVIGKKKEMMSLWDKEGRFIPVTLVEVFPCIVVRKKSIASDGYNALLLGGGEVKEKRLKRPVLYQFKKFNLPPKKYLKEFRVKEEELDNYKIGEEIGITYFQEGDKVKVQGKSKGKGFAGIIKRWGAHGGPASHGSMVHRQVGSVGQSTSPGRVYKGKKMPGHLGCDTVTIKNLEIVKLEKDSNLLYLKGSIPGRRDSLVYIYK